ncbi:response regulator [Magnetococcus sp. PR-3]|uniref:response regulator n=1 Tax=Magnetococcus sp. PR-3 TaxID=3120355 RepID=UPI002FCE6072
MKPLKDLTRILFADDEDPVRGLVKIAFRQIGIQVLTCRDGHEALERVVDFKPDLIILDYDMPPGPNGLEVAKLMRERPELTQTPIIFLSANNQFESEGYTVLHKPIDPFQFPAEIKNRFLQGSLNSPT